MCFKIRCWDIHSTIYHQTHSTEMYRLQVFEQKLFFVCSSFSSSSVQITNVIFAKFTSYTYNFESKDIHEKELFKNI